LRKIIPGVLHRPERVTALPFRGFRPDPDARIVEGGLRRLFSTFATGLPGVGLLIMRLVVGAMLIVRAIGGLTGQIAIGPAPMLVLKVGLGILLLIGLWTPVAGILVVVEQLIYLWMGNGDPWIHVLLATLAGALALVGPGAWSVDARLFGWKRIDLRDRQDRPSAN